jgi:hypothetical protein
MALLHNWISGDDPEDDYGCSPECGGSLCTCQMRDLSDEEIDFAEHAVPCEPNTDFPPEEDVQF